MIIILKHGKIHIFQNVLGGDSHHLCLKDAQTGHLALQCCTQMMIEACSKIPFDFKALNICLPLLKTMKAGIFSSLKRTALGCLVTTGRLNHFHV